MNSLAGRRQHREKEIGAGGIAICGFPGFHRPEVVRVGDDADAGVGCGVGGEDYGGGVGGGVVDTDYLEVGECLCQHGVEAARQEPLDVVDRD